jgi:hypothetical protein
LVQGAQTINNTVINLKKVEEFDKPLIDFRLGVVFHINFRKSFFFVQYMYGKSLVWVAKPERLRIE